MPAKPPSKKRAPLPLARPPRPRGGPKKPEIVKAIWKPFTVLSPVPVVMVSCMGKDGVPNIVTVAWTGTVCSEPPMLSISVRKERHSFGLIMESKEFVVNIPSEKEVRATDWCGVVSGRDVNKFEHHGITPAESSKVKPPLIAECPINIECKVRRTLDLGSHTMFIAEIVAVQVTQDLVERNGRLAVEKANLALFAHGHYYGMGKHLGHFGFSVRKKK